jgi:hypothetical protein
VRQVVRSDGSITSTKRETDVSKKTWSYVIVSVALAGTLQACGGGGGTVGATDTTPPTITAFTLPATAPSQTVSVNSFTATDDKGVTGYMVTQSATPPAATAAGWTATAPATVAAAAAGSQTFFPWAKDAAGNVSAPWPVTTVNIDTTAPVVTVFTLPATATSRTVSVNSFTATDDKGVTGYLVTQSATPPAATAAGWTATAPATVTAAAAGSQTFFPWAKNAAGNVSAVAASRTVTITLPPTSTRDTTAPAVTAFSLPASVASLTVGVSAFTATDDQGVAGYLVTQSATPPAAGDARWTTAPPATVTAAAAGSQTFYPWAEDAAGNVSAVAASQTVTITLPDTTAPVVTAFTLPASAASLTVSVSAFTANDNVAVNGYMVTQSSTPPAASGTGWTAAPPTTVTATGAGSQTFFPWAKDAAGNVSAVAASQTVTITLPIPVIPDTTAPTVTAFTLPASAASLTVSVSAFTATDNVAVTGYMVTQSSTPPGAGAAGWTATPPATVTAAAAGIQTFFPWAKDVSGNVSAVGTPATVTITVSVAVSASGTDRTSAVGVNATFTFASVAGGYQYNISGFGPGDKLVFPLFGGQPGALSIVNPIPNDGIVTVQLGRNVGGQKFDITVVLDGLTALQDGQIVDGEKAPFASFNAVFGANALQ